MTKLFTVLFSVALLTATGVAGQVVHPRAQGAGESKRDSVQGVWQAVEVTVTGPGARIIPIAEPRPNLIIITAGYYSRVEVHAEGPRPVPADVTKASADELRAAWGPFIGEAGRYDITDGRVITMRPIVAKNAAAMRPGSFISYSYKLDGDTMWVTEQRNQSGPFANPVTVKAVRVE